MAVQLPVLKGLDQAAFQVDQGLQQKRMRTMQLVFEVGRNAGEALATFKATKLQLESGNKTLEGEIAQLRLTHKAELKVLQEGFSAKIQMLSERVSAIAVRMDLYKKKYAQSYFFSPEMQWFTDLQKTITDLKREEFKEYPEYEDKRSDPQTSQESSIVASFSEALLLRTDDLVVRSWIEETIKEYEALEEQIAPLSCLQRNLCAQKSLMIDFHGKYMKALRGQETQYLQKNFLDPIRRTFQSIHWEKLATANPAAFTAVGFSNDHAQSYLGVLQQKMDVKLHRIKERMKEAISTLEAMETV
jgi:hypothetical protein